MVLLVATFYYTIREVASRAFGIDNITIMHYIVVTNIFGRK